MNCPRNIILSIMVFGKWINNHSMLAYRMLLFFFDNIYFLVTFTTPTENQPIRARLNCATATWSPCSYVH